jgi:guanylate kinase
MEKMIALGEFLETTEFSSNLYGTRLLNKKFNSSNKYFLI